MEAPPPRLLVVDDNEDNRYTLLQRLKRLGYSTVATATNGREALAVMREGRFDLLLLDVMMPEMNGYEVLEALKADEVLRDVPVIMISALDQIDSVIRCIELGADDYLAKPFNPTLLRARVGASLQKKRLQDALRQSLTRLENELEAARRLQLGMLPSEFPSCTKETPVELYAFMQPAREVGGDLYDFFCASPDILCFFVADVSGKGADAAMFMARTRSLVRMAIQLLHEVGAAIVPARVLETVNRELVQNNRERMFVTIFLGFLDMRTGALAHANAGHPPPHVIGANGGLRRVVGRPQAPLGVRSDVLYENGSVVLNSADLVFVWSDGITEAENISRELYGEARLESNLRDAAGATPAALVNRVRTMLDDFAGGAPAADDITMLALQWRPGL